jgi:uncharacterized protein YoaH (UPF0181 family)
MSSLEFHQENTMRFLSSLLALLFTMNVTASTGTVNELVRALDEYQYATTVEWDQKDQAFMQKATEKFYAELNQLMNQGLSEAEMMDVVSSKVREPQALEALKLKMHLMAKSSASAQDLARMIAQETKHMYATGASWDGYVYWSIGGGIIIAALIGYSIWWSNQRVCVAYTRGTQCGWVNQFPSWDPNYPNTPSYYTCWETNYCTQYEKR